MPRDRTALILLIVSLGSALGPFSNSIYAPALVALRDTFETTSGLAGATVAAYSLALAVSQLFIGPLADRFSAKRLLVGGMVLYAAASVLAYLAGRVEVFIVARTLQGVGAATGLVTGGAVITDRIPPERRAKAMASLQVWNAIGGTAGPLAGSAIAVAFVWQTSSLALLAAGLLLAVAAARLLPPIAAPAQRLTLASTAMVLRFPVTGAVALLGFVQFLGSFVFIAYMPLVLRERLGVPEGLIGFFFVSQVLGVLVGSHFGGRIADRRGARPLLVVGAWLAGLFMGLYALVVALEPGPWTLVALTVCNTSYSVAVGLGVPAGLATMVERFTQNRGAAVGAYASMRYFGGALGPIFAGLFVDQLGLASGFLATAGVVVLGALVAHGLIARSWERRLPGASGLPLG